MYLANSTRVDIAEAVNVVSRYSANPSKMHYQAVKHVWRYLNGAKDHGLVYRRTSRVHLQGWCDASYADDVDTSRSTGAYVTTMCGGVIDWSSRVMRPVALSTTEAEYMCASDAAKEIVWARGLLAELGYEQTEATPMMEDNQATIDLSVSGRHHKRTKHIRVRYHFIRQLVEEGEVALVKVHTSEQIADLLTKPLGKTQFINLRGKMMTT